MPNLRLLLKLHLILQSEELELNHEVVDFEPYGYDERQFCSPGIALNVGRITRAPNNSFPEYHSSADNLDFVSADSLAESLAVIKRIIAEITGMEKHLIFIK